MKTRFFLYVLAISLLGCDAFMVKFDHPDAATHSNMDAGSTIDTSFANKVDSSSSSNTPAPNPGSTPSCQSITIYRDADGDGYGNNAETITHCVDDPIGEGWSAKGGDCDDTNSAKNVSCATKTKPTSCPNNCADDDPYTWGYCFMDGSSDPYYCEKGEAWMRVQCTPPGSTYLNEQYFGCLPVAWIVVPNQYKNLGQSIAFTSKGTGEMSFVDLKTVCELLAQPGASMHVNAIALDKNNKQLFSIGGEYVKATDSFWWGSQHNPFKGQPGVPTTFDKPDYLFFFNDFPLCQHAKQEVESNGGTYPPPN